MKDTIPLSFPYCFLDLYFHMTQNNRVYLKPRHSVMGRGEVFWPGRSCLAEELFFLPRRHVLAKVKPFGRGEIVWQWSNSLAEEKLFDQGKVIWLRRSFFAKFLVEAILTLSATLKNAPSIFQLRHHVFCNPSTYLFFQYDLLWNSKYCRRVSVLKSHPIPFAFKSDPKPTAPK